MANIIWMPSAEDTYSEILENLKLDTALRLDEQVESLIDKIRSFTHFCPPSEKLSGFRRCRINKKLTLVYSTDGKDVYLVAFYYNKRNINF